MDFIQKIYYNNKPLILTTDGRGYIKAYAAAADYLLLDGALPRNFRVATEHLDKQGTTGVIITDASAKALVKELHSIYTPIDAGGGVVLNEDGNVLMIYRRGKWDLPKGKRDEGEEIDYCALREVSEETGLEQLTLGDKICDTYHVYTQGGENLLKRTTWYKMFGTRKEKLIPQKEENIMEARWVAEKDLGPIVASSYEAIQEVLHEAGMKWETK